MSTAGGIARRELTQNIDIARDEMIFVIIATGLRNRASTSRQPRGDFRILLLLVDTDQSHRSTQASVAAIGVTPVGVFHSVALVFTMILLSKSRPAENPRIRAWVAHNNRCNRVYSPIRVQARFETDIGTRIARDDRAGSVTKILRRTPRFLFSLAADIDDIWIG